MMTRKDFRQMAAICAETKNKQVRIRTAKQLAVLCAKNNPRFDRSKFLLACGVSSEYH